MAKAIESEIVSHKIPFIWRVSNFSVENLLEGEIISPPFKYCSTDFHLKISHTSDQQVQLQLFQSDSEDPPRISRCSIGFYYLDLAKWHSKTFLAPVKITDIFYAISSDTFKKDCVFNKVLKVGYWMTVSTLKHECQPMTQTAEKEKTLSMQGHKKLSESIGSILEDSHFSDVTLKVGEESFQAHKAILACRSKVFEGMFKNDMKESQESVVEMMDIKPTIVKQMLQYIYAAAIGPLSMDEATDLYAGADRYDLQELKGWCKEFLLKHISPEYVCRVAVIADLHSDEELIKASKRVFKGNPNKVVGSETWREFGKKNTSLQIDLLESSLISDC